MPLASPGQEVERLVRRFDCRTAFLMALAGPGVGLRLSECPRPNAFLAQVEALNNVAGIKRFCDARSDAQNGGTGCAARYSGEVTCAVRMKRF